MNRCCFPLETERAVFFFSPRTTQHGVFCYSNCGGRGGERGEEGERCGVFCYSKRKRNRDGGGERKMSSVGVFCYNKRRQNRAGRRGGRKLAYERSQRAEGLGTPPHQEQTKQAQGALRRGGDGIRINAHVGSPAQHTSYWGLLAPLPSLSFLPTSTLGNVPFLKAIYFFHYVSLV